MADSLKAKDRVENPEAHFDKPKEVVHDQALSHDEKKKALNTWMRGVQKNEADSAQHK